VIAQQLGPTTPACGRSALHVAAFTGGRTAPSARFRIRQYVEPLARLGVSLDEQACRLGAYPPRNRALRPVWLAGVLAERLSQIAASRSADVILLQRELVSTLPTLEGWTHRPRIVDIDDSIHLYRGGLAARRLAELADLVIVGNDWLAEIWRGWNRLVEILPTAVDTERHSPAPPPERPTIGWLGSADNLRYLETIAPALARVVTRFPAVEIAVCCDRRPHLSGVAYRYVPWSPAAEGAFLSSIGIGVMPLADGPWERGKCSFKMLQYMAAGRPCVVSPVGMNREILSQAELGRAATTLEEWTEALSSLIADRDAAQRLGAAGRALAVARYSVRALAPRLAALLRCLV
jgi:glycosyltransferase involved in cell wall biosynthesis